VIEQIEDTCTPIEEDQKLKAMKWFASLGLCPVTHVISLTLDTRMKRLLTELNNPLLPLFFLAGNVI
jgi:hypothetical protein